MTKDQEIEVEMQIWEYLDKLCNAEEGERIAMLVEKDPAWAAKYKQILAVHEGVTEQMELEHPSMRFTMNVMDAVKEEHVAPAAKTYMNKWVIRSIAAFVIVMIGGLMINAIGGMEARSSEQHLFSWINLDSIQAPALPYKSLLYAFVFCNVIAGLVLLDTILRRRRHIKDA
jgi:hypothetical protein